MIETFVDIIYGPSSVLRGNLKHVFYGYFKEDDVKGYPFLLVQNNNFRDQEHKDSFILTDEPTPHATNMIDGSVKLKFYHNSVYYLSGDYILWRETLQAGFVNALKPTEVKRGDITSEFSFGSYDIENMSTVPSRIKDKKVWYLEMDLRYSLTIKDIT